MTSERSLYLWPGQTHFGFGVVAQTGPLAKSLGAVHAFLLADPGVLAADLAGPVIRSLVSAGLTYTLHAQVIPNPDVASVDAAAAAYHACGADVVVALGGGSAIDTGKGVRMLAGSLPNISIAEFSFLRGENALPPPLMLPPLIAIPTTAGTGAEATPWGVITDAIHKQKFGVGGPTVTPTAAIIDPELTLRLPPALTAATGMDALTHLIEAFVSTKEAPALDAMILDAVGLIGRSLRIAVAQGDNRQARAAMMQAALVGGVAISSRWLGACHALAHPLSALANVPHGVANAIMLPHQMSYSASAALDRYAAIGEALDPSVSASLPIAERAEHAVAAVRSLLVDCGLPIRLRDVGVTEEMLGALGAAAIQDLNWTTNPRSVDQAVLEGLYRLAY
jgi:alcohol dehydrogenase class IV